jgi:hypothetical protein
MDNSRAMRITAINNRRRGMEWKGKEQNRKEKLT